MQSQVRPGFCHLVWIHLVVFALAGCNAIQPTQAAASTSLGDTYTSQTFDTSYPGALNAFNQLIVGMIRLEGTENALTAEQARTMLPLVQALQGRVLQSDAERDAVLAYIEAQLTPTQSAAIAHMRLTQADLQTLTRGTGEGGGAGGRSNAGQRDAASVPPASGQAAQATSRVATQGGSTSRTGGSGFAAQSGQGNVALNALIRLLAQKAAGVAAPFPANRVPNRTPASTTAPPSTPRP